MLPGWLCLEGTKLAAMEGARSEAVVGVQNWSQDILLVFISGAAVMLAEWIVASLLFGGWC